MIGRRASPMSLGPDLGPAFRTSFFFARYATWDDFVKSETSSIAEQAKNTGGWSAFREHASYHTDTLADRIAPKQLRNCRASAPLADRFD